MFRVKKTHILLLVVSFCYSVLGYAANTEIQNLRNVISVSKSGGHFTSVEDAINSISNAGENNRYLILVGPGRFKIREPIEMKEWVNIAGSGKNVTQLTGSTGENYMYKPLIHGSRNSNISDLEIQMGVNSTNPSNTALENRLGCTSLYNVIISINASSGITPTAVSSECKLILDNVDISVSRNGGGLGYGVGSIGDVSIRNSRIKANVALAAEDSSFTIMNSIITGLVRTYDVGDDDDEGRIYDSILQSTSELVAIQRQQIEAPIPLLFIRSSFITPNGLPEFSGDVNITCTLSDNGLGTVLDSNCAVIP